MTSIINEGDHHYFHLSEAEVFFLVGGGEEINPSDHADGEW